MKHNKLYWEECDPLFVFNATNKTLFVDYLTSVAKIDLLATIVRLASANERLLPLNKGLNKIDVTLCLISRCVSVRMTTII